MHEDNCFITLTYDEANLPQDFSTDYSHFQEFMRRLRKQRSHPVRFYMCGEYGSARGRPHYHAALFGCDFPDKEPLRTTGAGSKLFKSAQLDALWRRGLCSIGELTFESAAYIARYLMKKVGGTQAREHYQAVDPDTGEIHDRIPEFTRMSLKPGIGATWFNRYWRDVYPHDRVVVKGVPQKPPKYYDNLFEKLNDKEREEIQVARTLAALDRSADSTVERLAVREKVFKARIKSLKREEL